MVQNDVQKVVQKNNCRAYTRKKLNDIMMSVTKAYCTSSRVAVNCSAVDRIFYLLHLLPSRGVLFGDGINTLTNQKEAPALEIDAYSDIMNLSLKVWLFWNVSI